MTTLVFLASLGALIIFVVALEADGVSSLKFERKIGLFAWLTRGNWPAKIGGVLMIVGVGALLRYALLNVDIAPQLKLAGGIAVALAFGFASTLVPEGAAKRPVSLALGGAAFGVAYLTAYSAFCLFGYLSNPMGLALLGLTAAAMGVYAVTRSAQSLALLAMLGAYLAPAFSIQDPGPLIVYGYYAGASMMTLIMVAARGWRPLIHLSFLFTLGGGLFFAWTADYYTASHAGVMLPMVLLLSAIHVAMPILEKNPPGTLWLERLDIAYALTLPTMAALIGFFIAPTRSELSVEFMALGVIWGGAALTLGLLYRPGVAMHAIIALALFVLGLVVRFRDLPWELTLLGFTVAALAVISRKYPTPGKLHNVLAGFVVLFGALHILSSNASPAAATTVFINGVFLERFIAAVLLIVAGAICRRIRQSLDTLLLAVGILWLFISIGFEMIRWNLATLALIVHWFMILVAASLWIPGRRVRFADNHTTLLLALILVTAWWASAGAAAIAVWISLFAAALAVIGVAIRPEYEGSDAQNGRAGAALIAPVVAFLWASQIELASTLSQTFLGLTVAAVVAWSVMLAGRFSPANRRGWLDAVTDVFLACFALVVLKGTVFNIVRDTWAIALEIVCLVGLVSVTSIRHWRRRPVDFSVAACMLGVALILQANLLRLLGPDRNLDITDVMHLQWPTAISLLWAVMGGALTVWSRKVTSRVLWTGGAVFLVAAAVKLLLVDFGSLGQLANILAVIAAGGVFLLVGWLAPMPPAEKPELATQVTQGQADEEIADEPDDAVLVRNRRNVWSIALVVVVVVMSSDSSAVLSYFFNRVRAHAPAINDRSVQAYVAPEPVNRVATVEKEVRETESPPISAAAEPSTAVASRIETPAEAIATPIAMPANALMASPSVAPASSAQQKEPASTQPAEPRAYTPPPTVDERGVPTYTQFSLPQPARKPTAVKAIAAGDQGIQELLRDGYIRKATRNDLIAWMATTKAGAGNMTSAALESSRSIYLYRTYVVNEAIVFPENLTGADSVTLIVPRGIPRPSGDPGHSRILEMP